jgi:Gpi18-like mannosyltransferase
MQVFSRQNLRISALVLMVKGLVIAFGLQSYMVIKDLPVGNVYKILYIWKKWDALHYLKIAKNGYTDVGDDRYLLVFYPLYPALVACFDFFTGDSVLSGFIVSGIASVVLAVCFRELVRLDFPERVAQASVLFLLIFPTSFFLHIPYTESLFLALTVGAFLAARKRRWLIAGVLGLFACVTRVNGLILVPAFLYEVWDEYSDTKKFNKEWLYLLFLPVGIGGYLGLNFYVSGNPLQFLEYQRVHWHRYFRWPWIGVAESFKKIVYSTPSRAIMIGFQELLFVGIGLAATLAGWRMLRGSYRVWMAANWLLFLSTSFVLSVPRYTLTIFPLFIVVAYYCHRSRFLNIFITISSLFLLAFFITEFVQGKWVF